MAIDSIIEDVLSIDIKCLRKFNVRKNNGFELVVELPDRELDSVMQSYISTRNITPTHIRSNGKNVAVFRGETFETGKYSMTLRNKTGLISRKEKQKITLDVSKYTGDTDDLEYKNTGDVLVDAVVNYVGAFHALVMPAETPSIPTETRSAPTE